MQHGAGSETSLMAQNSSHNPCSVALADVLRIGAHRGYFTVRIGGESLTAHGDEATIFRVAKAEEATEFHGTRAEESGKSASFQVKHLLDIFARQHPDPGILFVLQRCGIEPHL